MDEGRVERQVGRTVTYAVAAPERRLVRDQWMAQGDALGNLLSNLLNAVYARFFDEHEHPQPPHVRGPRPQAQRPRERDDLAGAGGDRRRGEGRPGGGGVGREPAVGSVRVREQADDGRPGGDMMRRLARCR